MRTVLVLTTFGVAIPTLACASDLSGMWTLEVQDLQHQPQIAASIRFADEPARSCMAGTWKSVVVESISTQEPDFFPISGHLAYSISDGMLTLGRTEVCDGYLFLTGPLAPDQINGDYSVVSIGGSRQLGAFTLRLSR